MLYSQKVYLQGCTFLFLYFSEKYYLFLSIGGMGKGELIERARKIAAMMQNPNKNEAVVAARKLKKFLAEHNLTVKDLEGSSTTFHQTEQKPEQPQPHQQYHYEAKPEVNIKEDIIEVIYRKGGHNLPNWNKKLIWDLSIVLGFKVMYKPDSIIMVGLRSDITLAKRLIFHTVKHIEGRFNESGYTSADDLNGFGTGFSDSLIQILKDRANHSFEYQTKRGEMIQYYLSSHYTIFSGPDRTDYTFNNKPYSIGRQDGNWFAAKILYEQGI